MMNEREREYEKLWDELSVLDEKNWGKESLAFSLDYDAITIIKELLWYMENKNEYEKCAKILGWLNLLSSMIDIGDTTQPENWFWGKTDEKELSELFG